MGEMAGEMAEWTTGAAGMRRGGARLNGTEAGKAMEREEGAAMGANAGTAGRS